MEKATSPKKGTIGPFLGLIKLEVALNVSVWTFVERACSR